MPVYKHDWVTAEIMYTTSPLDRHKRKEWEKRSLTNSLIKSQLLAEADMRRIASAIIFDLECKVTLRTVSEALDIPYQSVRRYAARHDWQRKRVNFWIAVYKRSREKLLALLSQETG